MPSQHSHRHRRHRRDSTDSSDSKDKSTRSRSKSCDKGECKTQCHKAVRVDVENKPHAWVKPHDHADTKFDVALEVEAHPRCSVKHAYSEKTGKCTEKCVFTVRLDCDYSARAEILNCPRFKPRFFDLYVENESKTRCEQVNKDC